jgi:O-6-methylguanine DNA methyltransferase
MTVVREKTVTWVRLATTQAGRIGLAASENGLVLSSLPGSAPEDGAAADRAGGMGGRKPTRFVSRPRKAPPGVARILDRAEKALVAYYSHWPDWPGEEIAALWEDLAGLPVDLEGITSFSRKVLLYLRKVPPSMVISYGALAARAGSPRAARAVGAILARNPLPIILPCHRVIAADGTLGGFSGGRREEALRLKDSLLRYEGWNLERERDS